MSVKLKKDIAVTCYARSWEAKILRILIKLLIIISIVLSIVVLTGYVGMKISEEKVPVALMPSKAQATDARFISWVEHRIDDQELAGGLPLRGADGLKLADLDRDGYLDSVSVHEDSNHVRLAFGTGRSDRWILVTLAEGKIVEGAEDTALGDINGDTWPDLIVACEGGSVIYFQNPGGQPGVNVRDSKLWKSAIPSTTKERGSWIRVFLADLNNDGRLEAVATNKKIKMHGGFGSMDVPPSAVSWFQIPDNPLNAEAWIENKLGEFIVPVNGRPIDLDKDGDFDIIAGSRGESRMVLFENKNKNPLIFKKHTIKVTNRSVPAKPRLPKKLSGIMLAFADLNKDNRLDIITFETPWSVVWLEQPENWNNPWTIHPIGEAFPDSPSALTLFDINGDGRLDLFSGGYSQDPRDHDLSETGIFHRGGGIMWFEQPEKPADSWICHGISRRVRGMFDAFIPLDLNRDGLIDFVGTRGNSGEYDGVIWLEQKRSDTPLQAFFQARQQESRQLPKPPGFLRFLCRWLLN